MTPFWQDDHLTLYGGDCRAVLAELPPESVHCVVTSPPYWGLRDYGISDQLGLEPTPEAYVENMVAVFREVRRVLRADGTLWLNLGDSYNAGTSAPSRPSASADVGGWTTRSGDAAGARRIDAAGLKPKDLVGIPWRVAFALQQPYYTGSIPDERDRTWLAGLMDGEGTFTILSTTSPHGSGNSYPPIAQVRMTSAGVVGKAASLVGVMSPAQYPPSGTNRAVYQWRLSGGLAAAVARELYPYLIEKRKQALIAWNHQTVRESYETKRGVTIPPAALDKQKVARDLIRRLNHGEHVDIPSWMVEPPGLTEPGWYLRSDVIWAKPNPMPESVTDRPTKAHEYLFLLSKSPRYYFDGEPVRRPVSPHLGIVSVAPHGEHVAAEGHRKQATRQYDEIKGANIRTVWEIATEPYPGAHFATFPRKLVEPCVKAGTSERGVCPECGAPWRRETSVGYTLPADGKRHVRRTIAADARRGARSTSAYVDSRGEVLSKVVTTTGWLPSCDCRNTAGQYADNGPHTPVPAVVLDPFAGSGTTLLVAQALGRRGVGVDLNPEYLKQALARNAQTPLGLVG